MIPDTHVSFQDISLYSEISLMMYYVIKVMPNLLAASMQS